MDLLCGSTSHFFFTRLRASGFSGGMVRGLSCVLVFCLISSHLFTRQSLGTKIGTFDFNTSVMVTVVLSSESFFA